MALNRAESLAASHAPLAIFLGIVVLTHIGLFLLGSPLLLQDYPNHLARALVISDLLNHHGQEFGPLFGYHFLAVPYIQSDLSLVALLDLLGLRCATAVWPVMVFLALPVGLFAYLRARGAPRQSLIFMLALSVYLSTDSFFFMGFLGFRLGVGLVFLALALAEPLHREWSTSGFVTFAAVIVLAYLTHFAAIVFIIAALGVSALTRITLRAAPLSREVPLFLPLMGVVAWHFLVERGYVTPVADADPYYWGTVTLKLQHLLWDMIRYGSWLALVMSAIFAAAVLLWARGAWSLRAIRDIRVLEPLLLVLVNLGIYVALPRSYSAAGFVDVRALVFPPIFGMIGICTLRDIAPASGRPAQQPVLALALAALLLTLNLAYLARHIEKDGEQLAAYRMAVASIPEHSRVLPVYTAPTGEGVIKPFLHAGEFAVIDRHALTPYLFSANRGEPMTYFRYLQLPYAPVEDWYISHLPVEVDWTKVREQYQYLLVQKPFDPGRLNVKTTLVAESPAAALLAIR